MGKIIGQKELIDAIESFDGTSFPHTMLLIGEEGCGKHTVAKMAADRLSLPLIDITDIIGYDSISAIQTSSSAGMYLINIDDVTERQQNMLLKFSEEPSNNVYVMMVADSDKGILDTILNRCCVMRFKPYSKEELREFSSDESVLRYCSTPGQIKTAAMSIPAIEALCKTIVGKLGKARFDNAMSIADKLNYKDEYDKYDVSIFMRILLTSLADDCIINKKASSRAMYDIANDAQSKMADVRINRRLLIENMLIRMWRNAKNDMQRT